MAESAESSAYDLSTMGRLGAALHPLRAGVPLPRVTSFGKFLGGSATDVAVAAARLGRRTAAVTRTGDDPFGTYLREALRDVVSRLECSSAMPTPAEAEQAPKAGAVQ